MQNQTLLIGVMLYIDAIHKGTIYNFKRLQTFTTESKCFATESFSATVIRLQCLTIVVDSINC